MRATLLILLVAACSSPARVPPRPLGVADHLAEADRHEHDAAKLDEKAVVVERTGGKPVVHCGDQAVADQGTSGGERLGTRAPCWTAESAAVQRHRAASELRADARAHRAHARALATAEREACAGLDEAEIEHTPFDHREDIAAVSAELDNAELRGARIRFRPLPGLTATWMRQALACHHARAAAYGFDPAYMATCPSVVAGAETTVVDDPAGLVVVVRTSDPTAAIVIYGRAEALLDERPAGE